MFSTLRTKLLIGLTPLLALMVGLGLWAIVMFSDLGNKVDLILRENYRSVLAAQNMKEALERMDSAALFAIGGRDDRGGSSSPRTLRCSRRTWKSSRTTSLCRASRRWRTS